MCILSSPLDADQLKRCNGVDYVVASNIGQLIQFDALARSVLFQNRSSALEFKLLRPHWRVFFVKDGRIHESTDMQLRVVSLPGDEAALVAKGKMDEFCLQDYPQWLLRGGDWLAIYASRQRTMGKAAVPCVDGAIVALAKVENSCYPYLVDTDERPHGFSKKRPLVVTVAEARPLPSPEPVRWATHTWKWRVPESLMGFVAQEVGLADDDPFVVVNLTDGDEVFDTRAISPGYIGALNESAQRETEGELWWEVCDGY
jgi:hypothetical protein